MTVKIIFLLKLKINSLKIVRILSYYFRIHSVFTKILIKIENRKHFQLVITFFNKNVFTVVFIESVSDNLD